MLPTHIPRRPGLRRPCRLSRIVISAPPRQAGTSLIEFSIAAVPILLLGMGSIEATQWFFNRQALSLALLEAGRAAITAHARPAVIESAFEKALLPLFITQSESDITGSRETRSFPTGSFPTGSFPTGSQYNVVQRLERALAERRRLTGAAPWRIEVLSPTPDAFLDFSDPTLPIARETRLHAINNNYIAEQSQHAKARGWASAKGPTSGLDILQANTLVLRLTYLHEPILPGIKGLMRLLGSPGGSYGRNAMARGGYLPVVLDITLVMQSHPVDWPSLENGKVVKEQSGQPVLSTATTDCQGLWCMNMPSDSEGTAQHAQVALPQWPEAGNSQSGDAPPVGALSGNTADAAAGPPSDPTVAADDPACGVILCCAA